MKVIEKKVILSANFCMLFCEHVRGACRFYMIVGNDTGSKKTNPLQERLMKWLVYVIVIFLVINLLQMAFFKVREYLSWRKESHEGFIDWVKNPDHYEAAVNYFEARRSLKVPENISEEEIRQMVERLFEQEDKNFNLDRLKLVGQKAIPSLIEALKDPRTSTVKFQNEHVFDKQSPLERICELLREVDATEAVEAILPFVEHEDPHFRREALRLLAQIGREEHLPILRQGLKNEDTNFFVLLGIRKGMQMERPGDHESRKKYQAALFSVLAEFLESEDNQHVEETAGLLLKIDSSQALPLLLSDKHFSTARKQTYEILSALNDAQIQIPHEVLLPYLQEIPALANNYSHCRAYGEALIAYANHPDQKTSECLQKALDFPDKYVQRGAAKAISIQSGLPENLWGRLVERVYENDDPSASLAKLPKPVANFYAVQVYDSEVNNGGHTQYFSNSSGDDWKLALRGLKELGLDQRAGCLRAALNWFGESGPSPVRKQRSKQLSALISRQEDVFEEIDSRYYQLNENVDKALQVYAAQHAKDFHLAIESTPK